MHKYRLLLSLQGIMLKEILVVPDHVVLPEDVCQVGNAPSSDLDKKKQDVMDRIKAVRCLSLTCAVYHTISELSSNNQAQF